MTRNERHSRVVVRESCPKNPMPGPEPPSPAEHAPRALGFARTREFLAEAVSLAVAEGLPGIADRLDEAADRAIEGRDRQALFAAATRLRREASTRVAVVPDALARRAQRCLEAARRGDEPAALALIDDEELEQQIAAGDLAREIRERAGSVYPRYAARLRHLVDDAWHDEELNPLGARTLAAAALASLADAAEGAHARDTLRHAAWKTLAQPLADALARAERRLEEIGVPDAAIDDAHGAEAATAGPAQPRESEARASEAGNAEARAEASGSQLGDPARAIGLALRAERDSATLGSSPLGDPGPGHHLRVLPTLQPVLEIERDAVAFAHAIGAMPYSREARGEFFGNVRSRLRESGAAPAQVAVVDLVAAMFDYVIDDRRVPEAARPLVWRLQQPAVALSLLDPAYLGDDPRSLRRLVEHFGAISTAFAEDIARGSELHRRLETVVRAVEIVTSALQARSAVMAQQVEKEYSRAARSVGQLIDHVVRERRSLEDAPGRRNRRDFARRPSREREEQVTGQLHAMLAERLQRHSAPDSVRDFVMNVWLRHLRTAALRDGEQSAEFAVSLRVVDDLLWSLDGGSERRSRRELAQRIPPLIRLMTQGVREIGAKDEEFKAFFDELFLIHLRRMQRRERNDGATTRARGEPDTMAGAMPMREGMPGTMPGTTTDDRSTDGGTTTAMPQAHGTLPAPPSRLPPPPDTRPAEEGTDRRLLEILESLDLDDLPDRPVRCEIAADRAIERLARGDWIELLSRDAGSRYSKLAWINRRRTVVLLVRRDDRRAMSLRIDELRERFAQRRAYLLER